MKNIKDLKDLEDLPIETLSFRIRGKHAFTTKPFNNWLKYNRTWRTGYLQRVKGQ